MIAEEDQLRAQGYALLAGILARAPTPALLGDLGRLDGDDSELGSALTELGAMARAADPAAVQLEFDTLFIGLAHGELVPYTSYYLTGFLHEKPLARLRGDMVVLGITRADQVSEPEDHVAAVLEMMAGLIVGRFGAPADMAAQRRFFDAHLGCWAPRFFEDLEGAASAVLYKPVGRIGRLFMAIEAAAFEMAA
jgi:TorA maturation chaperone TorD